MYSIINNRVVRDGKVAVIYSSRYGAGWSTWNLELAEQLIFDPGLVDLILRERPWEVIASYTAIKWPHEVYIDGLMHAAVEWIPIGTKFRIDECDGMETIIIQDQIQWLVA
jgi:hypothetical protein